LRQVNDTTGPIRFDEISLDVKLEDADMNSYKTMLAIALAFGGMLAIGTPAAAQTGPTVPSLPTSPESACNTGGMPAGVAVTRQPTPCAPSPGQAAAGPTVPSGANPQTACGSEQMPAGVTGVNVKPVPCPPAVQNEAPVTLGPSGSTPAIVK